jgi:hypothetical protein
VLPKGLLLLALICLIAAVPVTGALAKDERSKSGLCVSLGGADLSIPPSECQDEDKPSKESAANAQGDGKGTKGEDGGKTGDKKAGEHSKGRIPRDSDAHPVALPPRARPVFGRAVGAVAVAGEVRVKLPGATSFAALSAASRLPNGTLVDASAGVIQVSTARARGGQLQTAAFSGTTFSIRQPSSASGMTELALRGGRPAACPRSTRRAFASAARSTGRRLWGNGHGRFRTRGRYGSATVRGTVWATEDRCDGTLVRVRRGLVAVRDFVGHRTVMVPAGHSHLARASG